ncbi:ribonuclease H-like domain-containing protein, partial [Lipomyces japonicus]|uniref:ribonuclease H-like domain-containing protein n=1 Tax=Lipomyces japonicus TaxID=56871 RepID=UPI0034CFAAE1
CDTLQEGKPITFQTALAKLRVLALWINHSPQRRQKWKDICQDMDLPDRYIEYDVEARWNSTYRMLDAGLNSKQQVARFLASQREILPFTKNDWQRLSQIHKVLAKFDELAQFISEKRPQLSLAIPIYYELHDLLYGGSENDGAFTGIDADISAALKASLKKYEKYYTFVEERDTYYTALILDPRVKEDLILGGLDDKD